MITYTFEQRFVPLIAEGLKLQTFRGPRLRHARPGERIALQDVNFRPILDTAICRAVTPCELVWRANRLDAIRLGGVLTDINRFAVADGFEGAEELAAWLRPAFGATYVEGFLIEWSPAETAHAKQLEVA